MRPDYSIQDPYLVLYAFFNREDGWAEARDYHQEMRQRLQISSPSDDASGFNRDLDSRRRVYVYSQENAGVVYLSLDVGGKQHPKTWSRLNEIALGRDWLECPQGDKIWGSSIFFGATVESLPLTDRQVNSLLAEIPLPLIHQPNRPTPAYSQQKWGDVWLLASRLILKENHPQVYLILSTPEQEATLNQVLPPPNSFDLIELSLHKICNQLEIYRQHRPDWNRHSYQLDADFKEILTELRQKQSVDRAKLSDLSTPYVDFVGWTTKIAALRQTVEINAANYQQTISKLRLATPEDTIFNVFKQQFEREVNQLKHDLAYDEITVQRIRAGLETIRADLELKLVEAEYQTAQEWRKTRVQNEVREKKEAGKERQRDLLIAFIGLILGITQVWPIIQGITPQSSRWWADIVFLVVIITFIAIAFGRWWLRVRGAQQETDNKSYGK